MVSTFGIHTSSDKYAGSYYPIELTLLDKTLLYRCTVYPYNTNTEYQCDGPSSLIGSGCGSGQVMFIRNTLSIGGSDGVDKVETDYIFINAVHTTAKLCLSKVSNDCSSKSQAATVDITTDEITYQSQYYPTCTYPGGEDVTALLNVIGNRRSRRWYGNIVLQGTYNDSGAETPIWQRYGSATPRWQYNGYLVSITGTIKYNPDPPMGEEGEGLIGEISGTEGADFAVPQFDEMFELPNGRGLIINVKVTTKGEIYLVGWSLPVGSYYTGSDDLYGTNDEPIQSAYYKAQGVSLKAGEVTVHEKIGGVEITQEVPFKDLSYVKLDGIVYVGTGGFTPTIPVTTSEGDEEDKGDTLSIPSIYLNIMITVLTLIVNIFMVLMIYKCYIKPRKQPMINGGCYKYDVVNIKEDVQIVDE